MLSRPFSSGDPRRCLSLSFHHSPSLLINFPAAAALWATLPTQRGIPGEKIKSVGKRNPKGENEVSSNFSSNSPIYWSSKLLSRSVAAFTEEACSSTSMWRAVYRQDGVNGDGFSLDKGHDLSENLGMDLIDILLATRN